MFSYYRLSNIFTSVLLEINFHFDVDGSGKNPVLEANSTYTDYNWVLIRDYKSKNRKIDDRGY